METSQKKLIDQVVLPKLVSLAENDKLPLDVNELSSIDFEDETKEYNEKEDKVVYLLLGSALCGAYREDGIDVLISEMKGDIESFGYINGSVNSWKRTDGLDELLASTEGYRESCVISKADFDLINPLFEL